jgi:hypothetical protein
LQRRQVAFKVFHENKKLNLELESAFSEMVSLLSLHDDMSAKPRGNCNMIMVNYANVWLVHTQVVSQLKRAKLEPTEHKAHSLLLGARTSCPLLRFGLDACAIEIRDLKHQIAHSSCYSVLSPPCDVLALVVLCLDLIWMLVPLKLEILSIKLLIPLATVFYPLRVMRVSLSRVSFSMLPKITPS